MNLELTLPDDSILEFQPGLPPDYNGPLLRGSTAISAKTNLAEIILQQLTGVGYFIRLSSGRILKKIFAKNWATQYGLYSNFVLKNDARKELSSIGKFHLRKDQYICYLTKETNCSVLFNKNEDFSTIDFFYSPKFLQELVPFFPELQQLLQESPQTILNGKGGWSIPSMKEITTQILDCPYDENTRQFYYDLKVRELLYQILEASFKRNIKSYHFTPFETARIHEARTILEKCIDKKPPSIKSLSRQVALNEFKLKSGFRKYFHCGIFEWLMEQKMQHAKQLILNTNKPIKEIASLVGYPRTTNFITAFRRLFGMTPGSLRRQ
ncbi:helix-turn-helix transcriptional regulator [Ferruginibacter sp.]|nr:helix-turn-helix transcriptional regulator [Ferruginibacter sp.]